MPNPVMISLDGQTLSQAEWARRLGLSRRSISKRFAKGWPPEKILATDLPRYPKRRGPEANAWRGGRAVMGSHRYVGIWMPDHPRATRGGHVLEHIVIAERALGKPLPPGVLVHHVNEIKQDNRNQNLVVCQDNAYHKLIHARMRIIKAGGNPDLDKICCRCKKCLPRANFAKCARETDGLHDTCRTCNVKRCRVASCKAITEEETDA